MMAPALGTAPGCSVPHCWPAASSRGTAVVKRPSSHPLSQLRTQRFHDQDCHQRLRAHRPQRAAGPLRERPRQDHQDSGHQRAGCPRGHGAPDPLRHQPRPVPLSGAAGGQQHAGGEDLIALFARAGSVELAVAGAGVDVVLDCTGCSAPGPMPNCIWGRERARCSSPIRRMRTWMPPSSTGSTTRC